MIPKKINLTKFILDRNKKQSAEFCTPSSQLERRLYRAQNPSEIIALKCMDGRLNLSVISNTPQGIIKPYRNIGGKFDLGWPYFGRLILDDIEYAVSKGRPAIILSTYHFSKGSEHRGCAGHGYDTSAAIRAAVRLREQFERAFGTNHNVVSPIVVGIETDEDGLIFHGSNGRTLNMAQCVTDTTENLRSKLVSMYPEMKENIVDDLLPMLIGNQKHIKDSSLSSRPVVDLEHKEQIIAIGRGFDWLHLPNMALIIGPYDPQWESAVATAGNIVAGNMRAKRVPASEGVLLLVSAPFRSVGADQGVAIEKAIFLSKEAERVLSKHVPSIMKKLKVLVGTVDFNTRKFYQLDRK